jgi:hypothetical protein
VTSRKTLTPDGPAAPKSDEFWQMRAIGHAEPKEREFKQNLAHVEARRY